MKKLLAILIGLLCLSMLSAFAPNLKAQQSAVDWSPMFHHDTAHTGYSTSTGPLTNKTLWIFPTGNSIEYISPAVVNGVVYVGSDDDNVYALNASIGNKIWSYITGGAVESSPAVADDVVYIGSGDNNVYALNATSGSKIWSFPTGGSVYSCPTVVNGVIYVGSNDFNVYALNAATGTKKWNFNTGNYVYSSPSVVNGVVYIDSYQDV